MKYQIVNLAPAFDQGRECVLLFLRDEEFRRRTLLVTDIEVSFLFDPQGLDVDNLLNKMNNSLVYQKIKGGLECSRTYCGECCETPPNFNTPIQDYAKFVNNNVCPTLSGGATHTSVTSAPILRKPFHGYQEEPSELVQVFLAQSGDVSTCVKKVLEAQKENQVGHRYRGVYNVESGIVDYFLQQTHLPPMSWIDIDPGVENIKAEDLPTGVVGKNKLVVGYYDIETIGTREDFRCDPDHHIVGMISLVIVRGRERRTVLLHCHTNDIELREGEALKYATEKEMLQAFIDMSADCDFFLAHNAGLFDWPYITTRARKLGCDWSTWSVPYTHSGRYWKRQSSSNQKGTFDQTFFDYPGKVMMDTCAWARGDNMLRLDSYSLESLAEHCKLEGKDEFKYKEIYPAWTLESGRLFDMANYCIKDSVLLKSVVEVKKWVDKIAALAFVCTISPQSVIERGVSYQVRQTMRQRCSDTHCYPKAMKNEYLGIKMKEGLFDNPSDEEMGLDEDEYVDGIERSKAKKTQDYIEEQIKGWNSRNAMNPRLPMDPTTYKGGYTGGKVLTPEPQFIRDIVATWDFSSLYPSEIIANNLCPSTLLSIGHEYLPQYPQDPDAKTYIAPNGCMYTREEVGVMPRLCKYLLEQRSATRQKAKHVTDEDEAAALDALQLGYKLINNSSYGCMGYILSDLSCSPVAQSVTSCGRQDLTYCISFFEKIGEIQERGMEAIWTVQGKNARVDVSDIVAARPEVVYGDTDSLFIRLHTDLTAEEMPNTEGMDEEARQTCVKEAHEKKVKNLIKHIDDVMREYLGFRDPMEFEYEERYLPMLLLGKKYYIAAYKDKKGKMKLKIRGVAMAKRTYFKYLQTTMEDLTNFVFEGKSAEEIAEFFYNRMKQLMDGQVPLEQLLKTVKLNKNIEDYKGNDASPTLAKMLRRRGFDAPVGDRIGYYVIKTDVRNATKYQKIYPEELMKLDNVEVDYSAYFEEFIKPFQDQLVHYIGPKLTKYLLDHRVYTNKSGTIFGKSLQEQFKFVNANHVGGKASRSAKSKKPDPRQQTLSFKKAKLLC